jgi:hypothetical protein
MKHFPVTIVDNFYENPDLIREFALSLEYHQSDGGRWPGSRSPLISELNRSFFNTFTNKLFSLFFDFDHSSLEWNVDTNFQKINKFSSDINDIKNSGWIHSDEGLFSGIVYLNPDDYLYSGTSIYKLKPGEENDCPQKTKYLHYTNSEEFDEHEHKIEKEYNNSKYIESIRIENVYNRLVIFESGVYHGVPSFYTENNEPRLTQVFFVQNLVTSSNFPIIRSRLSNV